MGMERDERRLLEITDTIFLAQQAFIGRKDGTKQFSVCIKTKSGELAALEMLTLSPDGIFSYKDASIGTIDSPEFAQYIKKFQPGPDLSALDGRSAPRNEEELYQRVSETYAQTKSLKRTAKLLSLSEERTRRILFTTGDYTCELHEKVVQALREGKSLDEAAEYAGVSRNKVHTYLPYATNK